MDVASGGHHTVAVRSDGRVVAWGSNSSSQPSGVPQGTGFVSEQDTNLALRSDGTVVGWGSNQFGQLNVPALPPGVTYEQVSIGWRHAVGLRSDGGVEVWGINSVPVRAPIRWADRNPARPGPATEKHGTSR